MLPYGIDYAVFKDRHMEHLRGAEKRRLIREAHRERERRRSSVALLWLGCRLVAWGQLLQALGVSPAAVAGRSRC